MPKFYPHLGREMSEMPLVGITVSRDRPTLIGNAMVVSRGLVDSGRLSSWPIIHLPHRVPGEAILTSEARLPGHEPLDPHAYEDGRIRVGMAVRKGTVLARIYGLRKFEAMRHEEQLVAAIFSDGASLLRDLSLSWPYPEEGIVLASWFDGLMIWLTVAVCCPLRQGDVLQDGASQRQYTVIQVADQLEGDALTLPEAVLATNLYLKRLTRFAAEICTGRASGESTFVSQVPALESPHPPFCLTATDLSVLWQAGLRRVCWEIATLRSDYTAACAAVRFIWRGDEKAPVVGLPQTTKNLFAMLQAMALAPELVNDDGQPVPLEQGDVPANLSLQIRFADEAAILAWSRGEVTKKAIVNDRGRLVPGGLLCQRIFGPTADFRCGCREPQSGPPGNRCPRCGVEFTRQTVRFERFGHIRLAQPVVHPWALAEIGNRLALSPDQVGVLMSGGLALPPAADWREQLREIRLGRPPAGWLTGPAALSWLNDQCAGGLVRYFLSVLPVLPAALRPEFFSEAQQVYLTSDLNDHYRGILTTNRSLRRYLERGAAPAVIARAAQTLQGKVVLLFTNQLFMHQVGLGLTGSTNCPLIDLTAAVDTAWQAIVTRPVNYVLHGVVIPEARLEPHQVGLPAAAALEWLKHHLMRQLVNNQAAGTIKEAMEQVEAARAEAVGLLPAVLADQKVVVLSRTDGGAVVTVLEPVLTDGLAISLPAATATRLDITFAGESISVHLPITPAARAEAAAFAAGRLGLTVTGRDPVPYYVGSAADDDRLLDPQASLVALLLAERQVPLNVFHRTLLGFLPD